MPKSKKDPSESSREPQDADSAQTDQADETIEEDPAVERGERIHNAKHIARGGKEAGAVNGAEAGKS